MQCPRCRSSDIKSLSGWYASGASAIDARTRGIAALYSVRTKGTAQTHLAQLVCPPARWRYLKPTLAFLVAGTVGVPVLAAVLPRLPGGEIQFPERFFIPSIVAIFACIPILWAATVIHNLIVFPPKMKVWSSQWMCGTCKVIFEPDTWKDTPSLTSTQNAGSFME